MSEFIKIKRIDKVIVGLVGSMFVMTVGYCVLRIGTCIF